MIWLELGALALCCSCMLILSWRLWMRNADQIKTQTVAHSQGADGVKFSPDSSAIRRWLLTLNIGLEPWMFVLGILMVASLAFSLVLNIFPAHIPLAAIAALGVILLLFFGLADIAAWRLRLLEVALIDALDTMRASLNAGLSARLSLLAAAQTVKAPLQNELKEIVARLDMGYCAERSVARLLSRYNAEATRLFALAWIARYQTGSDLATMLNSVARLMQERIRQRLTIAGQLSGTRYAAIFAGFLPYLLVPLFLWQEPTWFQALLNYPKGPTYLAGALTLQIVGFLWLRNVLRVEL